MLLAISIIVAIILFIGMISVLNSNGSTDTGPEGKLLFIMLLVDMLFIGSILIEKYENSKEITNDNYAFITKYYKGEHCKEAIESALKDKKITVGEYKHIREIDYNHEKQKEKQKIIDNLEIPNK